jgi:hypothetical protein
MYRGTLVAVKRSKNAPPHIHREKRTPAKYACISGAFFSFIVWKLGFWRVLGYDDGTRSKGPQYTSKKRTEALVHVTVLQSQTRIEAVEMYANEPHVLVVDSEKVHVNGNTSPHSDTDSDSDSDSDSYSDSDLQTSEKITRDSEAFTGEGLSSHSGHTRLANTTEYLLQPPQESSAERSSSLSRNRLRSAPEMRRLVVKRPEMLADVLSTNETVCGSEMGAPMQQSMSDSSWSAQACSEDMCMNEGGYTPTTSACERECANDTQKESTIVAADSARDKEDTHCAREDVAQHAQNGHSHSADDHALHYVHSTSVYTNDYIFFPVPESRLNTIYEWSMNSSGNGSTSNHGRGDNTGNIDMTGTSFSFSRSDHGHDSNLESSSSIVGHSVLNSNYGDSNSGSVKVFGDSNSGSGKHFANNSIFSSSVDKSVFETSKSTYSSDDRTKTNRSISENHNLRASKSISSATHSDVIQEKSAGDGETVLSTGVIMRNRKSKIRVIKLPTAYSIPELMRVPVAKPTVWDSRVCRNCKKIMEFFGVASKDVDTRDLVKEIEILSKLKHPNITTWVSKSL